MGLERIERGASDGGLRTVVAQVWGRPFALVMRKAVGGG